MVKIITISVLICMFLIFVSIGIGYIFYNKKIQKNCVKKTEGKVIKYSLNESRAPIIKYQVDDIDYKKALKYSYVTTMSMPFIPIKATTNNHVLDTKLSIKRNSNFSINSIMRDNFPIGHTMTVYYNPNKPQNSYVERYAPSYTGYIFLIASIVPIISIIIIFLVL